MKPYIIHCDYDDINTILTALYREKGHAKKENQAMIENALEAVKGFTTEK